MKLAALKHLSTKVFIIVITQLGTLQASVGLDVEGSTIMLEWLIYKNCGADLNNLWVADSAKVEHIRQVISK